MIYIVMVQDYSESNNYCCRAFTSRKEAEKAVEYYGQFVEDSWIETLVIEDNFK